MGGYKMLTGLVQIKFSATCIPDKLVRKEKPNQRGNLKPNHNWYRLMRWVEVHQSMPTEYDVNVQHTLAALGVVLTTVVINKKETAWLIQSN